MLSVTRLRIFAFFGLLLLCLGFSIVALSFSLRVDSIVNVDLYHYGLKFSHLWADKYSFNIGLLQSSVGASFALSLVGALTFLLYGKVGWSFLKFLCFPLLTAAFVLDVVGVYCFYSIDRIVNVDLYSFGLQFSSSWALNYWTYSRFVVVLVGVSAVLVAGSCVLLFFASRPVFRFVTRWSFSLIAALGFVVLGLSILVTSSVLAFIGLGLVFWGIILTFVKSEQYAKKVLLEASSGTQMVFLGQVTRQFKCVGDAVYLPLSFFAGSEVPRVFIPEDNETALPTPEQTRNESGLLLKKSHGLLVVAPGADLLVLLEKTLKTGFVNVKLQDFQRVLLKFVDELEIAKSVNVSIDVDKVRVELKNSAFAFSKERYIGDIGLYASLGSVIGSALACALTRSTGKPVVIVKEQISDNGQIQTIDYRLL